MKYSEIMRIVCSFTLLIVLSLCLYSQNTKNEIELSPRVGSVIDTIERNYFGLFPDIKEFKQAVFLKKSNDSFDLKISYSVENIEKDTILTISDSTFKILNLVVNNYENMYDDENPEIRFINRLKINKFHTANMTYKYNEKLFEIETMNDEKISGSILYIDNEFLLIWTGNEKYRWQDVKENIKVFYYKEIKKIDGAEYELIGGNQNIYKSNFDFLKFYVPFKNLDNNIIITPEINNCIEQYRSEIKTKVFKNPIDYQMLISSQYSKLFFAASCGLLSDFSSDLNIVLSMNYNLNKFQKTITNTFVFWTDVALGFNISERISIDAFFRYLPKFYELYGTGYGFNFHYKFYSGLLPLFFNLKNSLTATIGYNRTTIKSDLEWKNFIGLLDDYGAADYSMAMKNPKQSGITINSPVTVFQSVNVGLTYEMNLASWISINISGILYDFLNIKSNDFGAGFTNYGRTYTFKSENVIDNTLPFYYGLGLKINF